MNERNNDPLVDDVDDANAETLTAEQAENAIRVIARNTARRVLGRGLEEIQQAVPPETGRDREKRDLFSFNYGAAGDSERDFDTRRFAKGTPPSILNHPEKPLSLELGLAVPVPDIVPVTRPDMGLSDVTFSGHKSKLAAFTHRAIDEFLGEGAHRTQALRGFLSHLTQEDLSTVLAECVVQIDDEHLRESMRMLGPDEVQAMNWAAQAEVSERMLDDRGRPLERDVQFALGMLDRVQGPGSGITPCKDENDLAGRLERRPGWNGVYAGEVAQQAWTRYYHEPNEPNEREEEEKDVATPRERLK